MFPKRGLLIGLVTLMVLYITGFPPGPAVFFSVMAFLLSGGWLYIKLVYYTFPRDLWMGVRILGIIRQLNRMKAKGATVDDVFCEVVQKTPDKTAVVFEDRKMTFRELDQLSNRIANHFQSSLGLRPGDNVALFLENCAEYPAMLLGLAKIGVCAAFINNNLRDQALLHCIKIANVSAVVFTASLSDALAAVLPSLPPALSDACYSLEGTSTLPQARELEQDLKQASAARPPPYEGKSMDNVLCFIYTSGTTGLPKACSIRHMRFFQYAMGIHKFAGVQAEDVIYCTLPLYHTNGVALASGQMLFNGSTLVLRRKFSASNYFSDCVKHKCTVVFYIGEVCRYLLAQPKRPTDTQHCVRVAVGNGLRPEIWKDFQQRFQVGKIAEFYGATEGNTSMMNAFNKVGACGKISRVLPAANPVVLVRVDENGDYIRTPNGYCMVAGVDEPGELLGRIRASVVTSRFDGYQNNDKASSKKLLCHVFTPGDSYFASGDILRMDEEGFLYFCDRTGDTFRWKGENVSTTEVEATIGKFLELRDVVVYGVQLPGADGRAGMAAIVGSQETVDLASLAGKLVVSLPAYTIPIFIRLVKEVDLTGNFKLKKVQLRNEGFCVSDPVFMFDQAHKSYVPFTAELREQLEAGSLRL